MVLTLTLLLATVTGIGIAPAAVTADTVTLGDVDTNTKIDSTDARLVLQYAVGKIDDTVLNTAAADVDADNKIDSTDARLILQYAVGKINAFPGGGTAAGDSDEDEEYVPSTISPNSKAAGESFANVDDLRENAPSAVENSTKQFGYFALTTELNEGLPFNVALHAEGNHLTAVLPAGVDVTALIPTFTYYGASVKQGNTVVQSDVTALNFTDPVELTLTARDGSARMVTVDVQTLATGLPSMAVTLENYVGADAIKKEEYTNATFYLGGGNSAVCAYAQETPVLVAATIKGRGNSSWKLDEKKSYTLKLDKKTALLDMAASKNWALVANYEDKTLLRNMMGYYFAIQAGVPVVMQVRPVDMWIDGEYWGTYNLTEKIEIEPDRVNITDIEKPTDKNFVNLAADQVGYLLEFDAHVAELNAGGILEDVKVVDPHKQWQELGWQAWEHTYYSYAEDKEVTDLVFYNPDTDETFFKVPFLGKWVTVKKPSTENLNYKPAMREYIFQQVRMLDSALQARNHNAIYRMLDLDSFAAWALVQEMMDNTDSSFHSSVYMYKDADGKFTFGPVWDFDRSSGNCDYWHNGVGSILNTRWCQAAFNTDNGRAALKRTWAMFEVNTIDWRDMFKEYQQLIAKSREYNFERWDILRRTDILYNPDTLTIGNREYSLESLLASGMYDGDEYSLFTSHLVGWFNSRYKEMSDMRGMLFGP